MIKVIGSCGKLAFFFLVFLVVKCKKKKGGEIRPQKNQLQLPSLIKWKGTEAYANHSYTIRLQNIKLDSDFIDSNLFADFVNDICNEWVIEWLVPWRKNTCTEFSSNNLQWKIVQIVKWSIVTDEIFNVTPQLLQKCRCHLPNCLRFIKWLEAAYVDVHERRWNEPLNLFLRFPYLLRARCTVVRVVNISLGFFLFF